MNKNTYRGTVLTLIFNITAILFRMFLFEVLYKDSMY